MAEVTNGQQLRIYTGTQDHQYYQLGIEKTGISQGSSDETVSGIKTFSGNNVNTGNNSHSGTETFSGPVVYSGLTTGQILYRDVTLGPTVIVGVAAGDIGHADGAVLVPAPGAGYFLEFLSCTLVYDFLTAAYTGGGDDLHVLYPGFATVSGVVLAADLLGSAGDEIQILNALSSAGVSAPVNVGLSIASTAWTNPGTAAGVLRVRTHYRVHASNL